MFKKSKNRVQERINEGLQELYAFQDGKMFPVLVFVYNTKEQSLVEQLVKNTETVHYKTEDICNWCILHAIEYQIFVTRLDRIRPIRLYFYFRTIRHIGLP